MPYISASIIMNLLQAMSPALKDLKKEGKSGQEKIAAAEEAKKTPDKKKK